MFSHAPPSIYQSPKCFVTYGSMGHIDPKQVPSKSKPWSPIMNMDFIHKVDLIIPEGIYEILHQKLAASPCYHRVTMTLEQILSGDFFTEYIKRGNVLMLSEGRTSVDNMFTLREGVLTMYLDKEAYERAGLVGKPHGAKGNRGLRPRWIVTYDLRSPSMLHGKKGFDRLVYACKKVLNKTLTWLFCNIGKSTSSPDPLEKYFATKFTSAPGVVEVETKQVSLSVPPQVLAEGDRLDLELAATDLYEWLSLIRLESPRVEASDDIDPYLCRYQAPNDATGQMRVCKMSWQGFISTSWLRELLTNILTTCPSQSWFSLSATEFSKNFPGRGNELSLLRPPNAPGEYIMWEMKSRE